MRVHAKNELTRSSAAWFDTAARIRIGFTQSPLECKQFTRYDCNLFANSFLGGRGSVRVLDADRLT